MASKYSFHSSDRGLEEKDHMEAYERSDDNSKPQGQSSDAFVLREQYSKEVAVGFVEKDYSVENQKVKWDALRKSIYRSVKRVYTKDIGMVMKELFAENNLIRGRGLFCRCLMEYQMASPLHTELFAALVAAVNSKFPEVGHLLLRRILLQIKTAYQQNHKRQLSVALKFLAHLVNQKVVNGHVALDLLTLLLDKPTNDSVEQAFYFVKECGSRLQHLCPRGLRGILERFPGILHEGVIGKRVQFLIEGLMTITKAKFQGCPAVRPVLDLVKQKDQLTHEISLLEEINPEDALDIFKPDPQFLRNEELYKELKKTIIDEESDDEADLDTGSDDEDGEESDEEEAEKMKIKYETEISINLRIKIRLAVTCRVNYEEMILSAMILECCCEEVAYNPYYGLLGQRFCVVNKVYQENFEKCFVQHYFTIHLIEIKKMLNVACFFAHLLGTEALSWHILFCIPLTIDEATPIRNFLRTLFEGLLEHLDPGDLEMLLTDPNMQESFEGMFPKDDPKNTLFSIKFFTCMGLGNITEHLQEYLDNVPI